MDKDIILGNLENMGFTEEEDYKKKNFTNELLPIKMLDPETGKTEVVYFYNGQTGYRSIPEGLTKEDMIKWRAASPEGLKEREKEEEWRSGKETYMPSHMRTIPKELSMSNVYEREWSGRPTSGYLFYPNPEYTEFKEDSFKTLVKALDYNRKKGLREGKKTISFPTIHPCRANDSDVWGNWTLGGFVTIPVSDEPDTFFQYQRVRYSKNPKKVYVVLEGPEPKNNPERAKYLIASVNKKDQEEYPEWVKASLLESIERD